MRYPGRNGHVDFLRGVAILLVLLLHFSLAYGLGHFQPRAAAPMNALHTLVYNGNFGVTLFFVVSGYLITSMSETRWGSVANIHAKSFYIYRFARIVPSLGVVLAIIVALGLLGLPFFRNSANEHPMPASYFVLAVLSVLTFWHNVLMQSRGWFNYCLNIYWSLSVEEVFYLALPLVCLIVRRKIWLAVVCVVLIVYGPIYRSHHVDNELYFECGYFACFDAIAIGCLTALTARVWRLAGRPARMLRLTATIAFVAVYSQGIGGHEAYGFLLIALCALLYLVASVNDPAPSMATGRATRPLRWLGRHSYELYLFHIVILAMLRNILDREQLSAIAWVAWLTIFLGASALVAYLVARFISDPGNAALRRYFLPNIQEPA